MKSSLASLAGASLIFLAVVGAYGVWYARVAEKSVQMAELQKSILVKNETISRIAIARATLQKNQDPAHNLTTYLVAQKDVVAFISFLESTAKKTGTILEVMTVAPAEDTKNSPALALTLSIDGHFTALMQTLGAIEYAPYAISFSSLTLMKREKDLWHAEVRALVGSTQ